MRSESLAPFIWLVIFRNVEGFPHLHRTAAVSRSYGSLVLSTRSRRYMVADISESVYEQTSTEELLDVIIDESMRTSGRKPIIMEFDPASKAMWRNWKGTVIAQTWVSAVKHVIWAFAVYFLLKRYPQLGHFLRDFNTLWGQMLSVTTFTLTFFVNQTYTLWRTCLTISRTLQGRLSDLMMTLATHARRNDPDSFEGSSTYEPGSRKLLLVVARYVRLFHILCYGSFTRSHRPLLTPQGMRRLVERGVMTAKERKVLVDAQKVSATQRFNVVLMWIMRSVIEGKKADLFEDTRGFDSQILARVQDIRGQANSMESQLRGRMVRSTSAV
jgi:hypothetical protein